jgi:hypothetical protein
MEQEAPMNFMLLNPVKPRAIRLRAPTHELALVEQPADETAEASDEAFSRCGWFDSSLELAAGLQVTEFVDQLPHDLPLALA